MTDPVDTQPGLFESTFVLSLVMTAVLVQCAFGPVIAAFRNGSTADQ